MMGNLDVEAHLVALADEMKKLIEENFAKPPNNAVHQRLQEIKDEIHSHGLEVTWKAVINLKNPSKVDAEVTLWKPKTGLPPEDQRIYDEWFKRTNKIKEGD